MARQAMSIERLRDLLEEAESGNKRAERRMRLEHNSLVRLVNSQLRALEKAGYDYYAYDRAVTAANIATGKDRFSTLKKYSPTASDVYEQILEMNAFRRADTSTVSKQKAIVMKRADSFRKKGLLIPQGKEKAFADFLSSDAFSEAKQAWGSTQAINIMEQVTNQGTIADLQKAFDLATLGDKPVTIDIALESLGIII